MEHRYQRRVAFADTDAAGVVHFSRVLCYVEEAEHALLEKLGIPLLENGGWPRVNVRCDYSAPLRPGETAEISISPQQVGGSSIGWEFVVHCGATPCARGTMKTVRVDAAGKPAKLEAAWREALEKMS